MERIKLSLNKIKNKIVKINGQRVEIKPFISNKDVMAINKLCLQQFNIESDLAKNITTIKYLFDMFVIHQCTNIDIAGITLKEVDGKSNVEIDLSTETIEEFDNSQIIKKILPFIINYQEIYDNVKFLIELKNVQNSFKIMGESIPDVSNLGNVLGDSLKSLAEFKEKDPETFNKIVSQVAVDKTVKEGRKEFKETKKKAKTEKAAEK